MNDPLRGNLPMQFYWISGAALLWNIIGIAAYVGQVSTSPESVAEMPEVQRVMYENVPAWATSAYAIAVNAGALGCLLLLLRRALALPVLVLSLAGVLVQFGHVWFMTDAIAIQGVAAFTMPGVIVAIGCYLVWFANDAKSKGWVT